MEPFPCCWVPVASKILPLYIAFWHKYLGKDLFSAFFFNGIKFFAEGLCPLLLLLPRMITGQQGQPHIPFPGRLKHHLAHTSRLSSVMLPYIPPQCPTPAATIVFVVLRKDLPNYYHHVLLARPSQWTWEHFKSARHHHKLKDLVYPKRAAV